MTTELDLSAQAMAYARARFSEPEWATGSIALEDAAFLFEVIMAARPRSLVEIGVAAGVSTTFLSTLLADRLHGSQLWAFDALEAFYDDPSRRTGAYVQEVFGEVPANLKIVAGVASTEIRRWSGRPRRFDFAFIDANHLHPWPCIDILSILDILEPGAWIALHDIRLALVNPDFQAFGPMYLYNHWPGEKRAPAGNYGNIGAIRLSERHADSAAALIDCCRLPWQVHVPYAQWRPGLEALSQADPAGRDELHALASSPTLVKHPDLRHCEVTLRGANPWTRLSADLTSGPVILHANRTGDPALSVTIDGLRRATCNGVVLPCISASPDAGQPLSLTITASGAGSDRVERRTLLVTDRATAFAYVPAPPGSSERFRVTFEVSATEPTDQISGKWIRLEMVQFV